MSAPGEEQLRALRDRLVANRSLYFAVKETQAKIAERAFERGGLTDGGTIQYKENYDLYAYTPPSPRKVNGKGKPYKLWKRPPKGAKGRSSIKGGWYPTYLAYKQQQGRKDTPFELTANLRKAFLSDATLVESGPTVVKVVLSGDEADKHDGLVKQKGEFLLPTTAELDFFLDRLRALT